MINMLNEYQACKKFTKNNPFFFEFLNFTFTNFCTLILQENYQPQFLMYLSDSLILWKKN